MAVSQKRMYSTGAKPVSTETLDSIQVHLSRAIEAVWLTAAFLVPLLVLSEYDFTSFTELPKIVLMRSLASTGFILWLISIAVGAARRSIATETQPTQKHFSFRKWVFAHPIEFSAALILGTTAFSAAISIQPLVSALGADWGRDGYDLHTTASYIVIFFLAATRIRKHDQLIRLWVAISVTGLLAALIGISQHFALAPFGISGTYQHQRVTGTVGNPLFLGSLLTITLPMGTALALAGAINGRRWLGGAAPVWWGVLTSVVFIHIYAALLTASRGPWLGMAAALLVLIALTAKSIGLKNAGLTAIGVFAGVGLALSIVVGPFSSGIESFAVSEQQELFNQRGEPIYGTEPASASSVISQRGRQGTIGTRLTMWETTGDVIADRPELPDSNNAPWLVRQVFGYGPDTFRFVFPTKAPGEFLSSLTSAAHNDPLNRLVEIGLAGLLAYSLLVMAAGFAVWRLIIGSKSGNAALVTALTIGIGAAVVGRIIEQMSGVPEVSDTLLIWLALALLAAAYSLKVRANQQPEPQSSRENGNHDPISGWPTLALPPALVFPIVAIGIILAGYLIWAHNINLIRSDLEFRKAEVVLAQDVDLALDLMERAVKLNPGVEDYQHGRADILQARADLTTDLVKRTEWLEEAYEAEAEAVSFNPTSRSANFELAFASWELAQLGSERKAIETLRTYERLSELAPAHPLVIERLAQLKLAVGSDVPR